MHAGPGAKVSNGAEDQERRAALEARVRLELYQSPGNIHWAALAVVIDPQDRIEIKGGLHQLVYGMINRSRTRVRFNTKVAEISYFPGPDVMYRVVTVDGRFDYYDAVVVAVPQDSNSAHNLILNSLFHSPSVNRIKYRTVYTTVVVGQLKWPYFNVQTRTSRTQFWRPRHSYDHIVSTEEPIEEGLFNSITTIRTLTEFEIERLARELNIRNWHYNPRENTMLTKISSYRPLAQRELNILFENRLWTHSEEYFLCPELTPREEGTFPPIKLHERVYYPNAMDAFVYTTENAMIAGRNTAQLLATDFQALRERRSQPPITFPMPQHYPFR
ncbi:hypothetical protein H4R33_000695 [Dimargaris cristalligena]|nr:hypothetical protein H4R33_000695 [Dimargaris cristalligena]